MEYCKGVCQIASFSTRSRVLLDAMYELSVLCSVAPPMPCFAGLFALHANQTRGPDIGRVGSEKGLIECEISVFLPHPQR
jgi:hypothetical protein